MTKSRIYNQTNQELIVVTRDGKAHVLCPRCVSPSDAGPFEAICYDDQVWRLEQALDVHVTELAKAKVGVFGLGVAPAQPLDANRPYPAPSDAWFYREDEIWVTVLGAGITGLSAAHELVKRGFRVQIIERAHGSPAVPVEDESPDQRFSRGLTSPDVGGIARTQWATQPLGRAQSDARHLESLRSVHGDAIWFDRGTLGPVETSGYHAFAVPYTANGPIAEGLASEIRRWLGHIATIRSVGGVQLVVVVYGGEASSAVHTAYRRLEQFVSLIANDDPFATLQVLPTARIDVTQGDETDASTPRVGLLVRTHDDLRLIAGEHGFRFFPGFYRHLRDTMRRTAIYDPEKQAFTSRTAYDNLHQVDWQVLADPTRRQQTPFARRPITTLGGILEQYRALRRGTGYRPSDLLRFCLRFLRYATSSTVRRQKLYETMSWWDFLSRRRLDVRPKPGEPPLHLPYGARFKEALIHSPKALVAMGSEHADARTQGNLSVQLLMDQFGLHDQGDSTLVGPTSTAWLQHWKTYLHHQGVQFFLGDVTRISRSSDRVAVEIQFPARPAQFFDPEMLAGKVAAHYFLSALDVVSLARVTAELRSDQSSAFADLNALVRDANGRDRDLEDIKAIGQGPDDAAAGTGLGDRFQTLSGIQLYYERRVSFVDGHIYYASSPWGLSALSQEQYWGPFGNQYLGGLASNLSIDIGSWRAYGDGRDPNTLTRDAIALDIENQIDRCTRNPGNGIRQARYYHLDDFIGFALTREGVALPVKNYAPFLINVVGDWNTRPRGEPWSPHSDVSFTRQVGAGVERDDAWFPDQGGYPVYFGNLLVAGPHMRTFTRMATMEAANESARHAVNSLMDHLSRATPVGDRSPVEEGVNLNVAKNATPFGDYCDIWDPEASEFPDLDFLRVVDKYLMEAGPNEHDDRVDGAELPAPPHLFDILKLDDLPDLLDGDREADAALAGLGSVLKAFEHLKTDDTAGVRAAVARARAAVAKLFAS